jgi:multidrug efflux pump
VRLSQRSIERPVLATVMSLVIVLAGLVAVGRLEYREYPDVDPPVVTVTTVLPGAAPDVVETSVTQPLEDELIGIAGIKHLSSMSSEQVSQITVEFELSQDVDLAANDVRDRVARVRGNLPDDVDEPVVSKTDADASPIMWFALSGKGFDQVRISTIAETQLKDRFSKLPGVAEVIIAGERRYAMRIWLDNNRLTAQGLTVADVADALRRQNVDLPSGRVESEDTEFTVRTLGELTTPEEYEALIVATVKGQQIALRDVARVEIGPEDDRKMVRFNGRPGVGLGIVKQSNANTLDVADAVQAEAALVRPMLPEGVQLEVAFDSSRFIQQSLDDVRDTIIEAIVLVVIVIYLFLRSLRATIVPAVAIPVSVIGTFAVLYFLGFSINTLTLMGLTLAIGLVVDDAIVVLENVSRWVEGGTPPFEAARRGMDQIAFAVIAATVSTVAVFLPLAFLTNATGRLFREFGIAIAAAVVISGFVALTLAPMLCARVLRAHPAEGAVKQWLARAFDRLGIWYDRVLGWSVAHRGMVLALGAAWVVLGLWLLGSIPREFITTADRSAFITMTRAPEGSTIAYTSRYQRQVEQIILAQPEVARSFSVVALGIGAPGRVNEGALFTSLRPRNERRRSQQEIVDALRGPLFAVPGIMAFAINMPAIRGGVGATPIDLEIQGPSYPELARYADDIVAKARAVPGLVNLQTDLVINKPQLEVKIDRSRAADLGVSVRDIATTLQILLGGRDLSTFKLSGETYDVMVRLAAAERSSPRDLYLLNVRGRGGELISLGSLVHVQESVAARGLPHFDRQRSARVQASLAGGATLGAGLEAITKIAREVLPAGQGYHVSYAGESEDFFTSSQALAFAYALAVVIVFLVLAGQFESFLDPVTILVAVALSFTGALVGLLAVGGTLNLFSQIGLVMLVGLVTKNSILIVEFANQLTAEGRGLVEATIEAAHTRFRPILMTAVSTIVGILPVAAGVGEGGEARAPLGVAVVGGMLFSTVLSLVVVPAVHIGLGTLRARIRGRVAAPDRGVTA